MEPWKKPGSAPDKFDYFVKTERTRAMAKVNEAAAARVDQDLAQVVGG